MTATPAALAAPGPALAVDAGADQHAISADIYGLNFADPALAQSIDLPVDRWGGNTTDTYNWQLWSSNTGNDYYYENIADCWDAAHGWCASGPVAGYREFIDKDRSVGAKSLITLPMVGRVAKDALTAHPFSCGFPRTVFSAQDSFDPYDTNCGNGLNGGSPLASDPTRTGTAVDASFSGAWIDDLKNRYGSAAGGGVPLYELGNEPALWGDTHRDVHPAAETYDELWQKSRDLAAVVKARDPGAKVLGFSEWGWPNYFCSGADHVSSGCFASSPDRVNHGGTPLVEWFLQQMRQYQQTNGTRLLDYLDLHYYRQGGSTTDVTRSLWDPTFTDPSWINDQIQLIPRMKQWIANDYPGTRMALSEYNLSVPGDPVANALIQADTLGIFAREGVDLATRWPMGNDGNLIGDAFRIFRNYDGSHSKFGDTWVRSTSADQGRLAVYGARRASDGALTVLAINKTAGSLTSQLALSGATPAGPAQVWQWTGGGIARAADQTVGAGGFQATYPPRSMTLFVVPPSGSPGGGGEGSASGDGGSPGAGGSGAGTVQVGNPTPGRLALNGSSVRADSAGNLLLNFSCRGAAPCQGKLDIYARMAGSRATRTKKRIRLVTRKVTIAPGATVKVKMKLSRRALRRLGNPSRIKAAIEIRTTSAGQLSRSTRSLTIKASPTKKG